MTLTIRLTREEIEIAVKRYLSDRDPANYSDPSEMKFIYKPTYSPVYGMVREFDGVECVMVD